MACPRVPGRLKPCYERPGVLQYLMPMWSLALRARYVAVIRITAPFTVLAPSRFRLQEGRSHELKGPSHCSVQYGGNTLKATANQ
jgi:hypothetical protein